MKFYDYADLETKINCPKCDLQLFDVTEYFEMPYDTFTCQNMHSFSPEYVYGFWDGYNKEKN